MGYDTTFRKFASNTLSLSTPTSDKRVFARVVDVVLDDSHPQYNDLGKIDAIGAIKYKLLRSSNQEEDGEVLPVAFPSDFGVKEVPLIDEIVEILNGPSNIIDTDSTSITKEVTYYTRLVNLWNSAHHNALPNQAVNESARLGENFNELSNIANLQPYPGDIYIEGRFGQSLRFSGASSSKNSLTDSSNNSKPFTILRNGQKEVNSVNELSVEDINEDDSSIYLTSDHSVPLQPISTKYDTYSQGDQPESASTFKGRQVLIDSGRVFINAKDDSILLSSNTSIGVSSNTVNIDGEEYFQVDAKKLYLGVKASDEEQPVVLGKKHEELFLDLLSLLKGLQETFNQVTPAPPQIAALLVARAGVMLPQIQALETKLKTILSKKTFSE